MIITRRLYSGDLRRHFVGIVERFAQGLLRVHGYAFVYDMKEGGYVRRKNPRDRLFPLDNHIVVFILPDETEIGAIHYQVTGANGLVVTDGKGFQLEISEFNG